MQPASSSTSVPMSSLISVSMPVSMPSLKSTSQKHYSAHDLLNGLSVDEVDDFIDQVDAHYAPSTIPYNFPTSFPNTQEIQEIQEIQENNGEEDYKEKIVEEVTEAAQDDIEEELRWLSLSDSDSAEYSSIPQPRWSTKNGRLSPESYNEIVKFIEDSKKEAQETKERLERKEQAEKQGGVGC